MFHILVPIGVSTRVPIYKNFYLFMRHAFAAETTGN